MQLSSWMDRPYRVFLRTEGVFCRFALHPGNCHPCLMCQAGSDLGHCKPTMQ
jgi:hypothetical protein